MKQGQAQSADGPLRRKGRRDALAGLAAGLLTGLGAASLSPGAAGASDRSVAGQPAVTGLVVYEVGAGGALDGVWTIPAYEGRTGTEQARGGPERGLAGAYSFTTLNPAGELVLQGTLEIVAQGSAWRLTWSGVSGDTYEGVGLSHGDRLLAALYWGPVT